MTSKRFIGLQRIVLAIVGCLFVMTATTHAAETREQGLAISPVRKEMTLAAGQTGSGKLMIANKTSKAAAVSVEVKTLSVTDRSYDYRFKPLEYDWVKLANARMSLEPGAEVAMPFEVAVPHDAASGGYYFVLIASTPMAVDGVVSTVQAAMPLYVTVDGGKLRISNEITAANIPFVAFGDSLSYSYDVKNAGNVHMNGQFFARLDGLFGNHRQIDESHAVFPHTSRTIRGTFQMPPFPAVFQLTYGYSAGPSQDEVTRTVYVVNLPPWTIVAVIVLIIGWRTIRRRDHHERKSDGN